MQLLIWNEHIDKDQTYTDSHFIWSGAENFIPLENINKLKKKKTAAKLAHFPFYEEIHKRKKITPDYKWWM